MMETHDPMRDNIFKVIFQNHPDSLRHLLNSFLPLPHPIDSIVFLSNELHDFFADGRVGIVDVRCRDTQGRTFIVEMQIRKTPLLLQRLIWNAARILARQPTYGGWSLQGPPARLHPMPPRTDARDEFRRLDTPLRAPLQWHRCPNRECPPYNHRRVEEME